MAGEGRERPGVVTGPAAVKAAQGAPAGLGGAEVVGGGQGVGAVAGGGGGGLSPAGRVEGAVSGGQSVLWQRFTLDRGAPRPPVAAGAPAGLAPVVPVEAEALAVDALERHVQPLTDTRQAALTVDSTNSVASLIPGNYGRRYLLGSQV